MKYFLTGLSQIKSPVDFANELKTRKRQDTITMT